MGIKSTQKWAFIKSRPHILLDRCERWRRVAKMQSISREGMRRLEWIIYYETKGEFNATFTCRHFGIARKTLYKFLDRFDSADFQTLEDKSRAPIHVRQKEITLLEEDRIKLIRKQDLSQGKEKIRQEYNERFGEDISCHKILYTIQKHKLYPNPQKIEKQKERSKANRTKKKITDLKTRNTNTLGFLIQIDTIVLHLFGLKRYILTAIDKYGKIAFAHTYKNHSSGSASDFLKRLNYLFDDQIVNIQTDHGSEFAKEFEEACKQLKIEHYFSRVRTPKDNAVVERFNRTLQEEWLDHGHFHPDLLIFNKNLTHWLAYYNSKRRHASLNYQSPINYCIQTGRLLPMSSTGTKY
ncbi:MAG: integrase core domain-containing protein [bacterium]|nr:integrase core domain-containing protein [bacterium]